MHPAAGCAGERQRRSRAHDLARSCTLMSSSSARRSGGSYRFATKLSGRRPGPSSTRTRWQWRIAPRVKGSRSQRTSRSSLTQLESTSCSRAARESGGHRSAAHAAHGSGDPSASSTARCQRSLAVSVLSANRLRGD
eukprot:scaffold3356_cov112-Isochrysis_galbana.AAC.3